MLLVIIKFVLEAYYMFLGFYDNFKFKITQNLVSKVLRSLCYIDKEILNWSNIANYTKEVKKPIKINKSIFIILHQS